MRGVRSIETHRQEQSPYGATTVVTRQTNAGRIEAEKGRDKERDAQTAAAAAAAARGADRHGQLGRRARA